MPTPPTLLAVPNVSEGRDRATIAAIAASFAAVPQPSAHSSGSAGVHAPAVRLLDVHSDADHHRSVFTLAGPTGLLADALLRSARTAVERIDVMAAERGDLRDASCDTSAHHTAAGEPGRPGQHPHVGAIDVVPVVYFTREQRGAACAEALVVADRIAHELQVPVFLYGELSGGEAQPPRTRAQLRRGGVAGLAQRMAASDAPLVPDFGPAQLHPTAGATLVAARPPLVAFNVQLAPPATLDDARAIASLIRDRAQPSDPQPPGPQPGGPQPDNARLTAGLPGLRAIGVLLQGNVAQVSMNVERPFELALAEVVQAVRAHGEVASAELVGLAPAAALEGFPQDVRLLNFDPARHVIENALGW